jgi:hypothetical protein
MRPSREEGLFVLFAPFRQLRRKRPPAGEAGTRRPAIAGQAGEASGWGHNKHFRLRSWDFGLLEEASLK